MSVVDDLIRLAQQSNINPRLFLSVAQVESDFNPNAIGDHGTSFGLFQLHRGGQAPNDQTDQQLLDPTNNARLAIPGIKQGLASAGPFDNTRAWWQKFASASGHPGGTISQASDEADKLQRAYASNSFQAPESGSTNTSSGFEGIGSFFAEIGLELLITVIAVVVIIVALYLFVR